MLNGFNEGYNFQTNFWDQSPFLKAYFKKSVKYFGVHMKDAKDSYQSKAH